MKRHKRSNPRQKPAYQFTLDDMARMVGQLGGRIRFEIYPKELDAERLELERLREQLRASSTATNAVDPHAGSTPV